MAGPARLVRGHRSRDGILELGRPGKCVRTVNEQINDLPIQPIPWAADMAAIRADLCGGTEAAQS
jgi:hypothetical protein